MPVPSNPERFFVPEDETLQHMAELSRRTLCRGVSKNIKFVREFYAAAAASQTLVPGGLVASASASTGPFLLAPLFHLTLRGITAFGSVHGCAALHKLNELVKIMRSLIDKFSKGLDQNEVLMFFSVTAVQHVVQHGADGISSDIFDTCLTAWHELARFFSRSRNAWLGLNDVLLHCVVPPLAPIPDWPGLDASTKKVMASRPAPTILPVGRARFLWPDRLVIFGGRGSIGGEPSDDGSHASSSDGEGDGWFVAGPLPGQRGKRLLPVHTCAATSAALSDISDLSQAGVSAAGAAMSLGSGRHVHWPEDPLLATSRMSPASATWCSPDGPDALSEDLEMENFTWRAGYTPGRLSPALSPISCILDAPPALNEDLFEALAYLDERLEDAGESAFGGWPGGNPP